MKIQASHRSSHRVVSFVLFAQVLLFPVAVFATTDSLSVVVPAPPKTHVLFVGADIALEQGKTFQPVEDVTGTTLVIKPEGKRVDVPMEQNPNLRVTETLKIARTNVAVNYLTSQPAYTPMADPMRKYIDAMQVADAQADAADVARANAMRVQMFTSVETTTPSGETVINPAIAAARDAEVRSLGQSAESAGLKQTEFMSLAAESTIAKDGFDALRVSFDLVPEKDLANPYYALIAQVRDPGSKPGHVRRWVYVKSLGRMQAGAAETVRVFQGGFPPGFVIESTEVHVYDNGQELATNLARKRVPLTDDEAFQFVVIDYIGLHKGATATAKLAVAQLDPAQLERLAQRVTSTCYLRVNKLGRVADVFADSAQKHKLADTELAAWLSDLRFYPALEKGVPIDVLVPLEPGKLTF